MFYGNDYRNKIKTAFPVPAIWAHVLISVILALTGSFENILLYAGFVLQLMSSLTVATSLFINSKDPAIFRSPFKPLLQLIFLAFNLWILVFTLVDRPFESLIGLGILAIGATLYLFDKTKKILPATK
jgi:APA family basic amino acid/polyamine antiporter